MSEEKNKKTNEESEKDRSSEKILRYSKQRNINIGIAVFAILLIYLIAITVRSFVTPSVKGYEVNYGNISSKSYYSGVILRSETVVNADYTGYVNYYYREKLKAAAGNLICTIDEDGKMTEYLNSSVTTNSSLSADNLKELKDVLSSYSESYTDSNFSDVYEVNTTINSMLMEYINVNTLEQLDSNEDEFSFQKCYAAQAGIVLYSTDGYESLTPEQITADMFSKDDYLKNSYTGSTLVEQGTPIYKMITDDTWNVVFPLQDGEKEKYLTNPKPDPEKEDDDFLDSVSVKVTFTDKNLSTTGTFSIFTGADGTEYGSIEISKYMIQFINDRFINIEIDDSDVSGLKIPASCVIQKDVYAIPSSFLTQGGDSGDDGFMVEEYAEDGSSEAVFHEVTIVGEFTPTETADSETDETAESADGENAEAGSGDAQEKQETQETDEEGIRNKTIGIVYVTKDSLDEGSVLVKPDDQVTFRIGTTVALDGVYNINKGYAVFKYINILEQNSEYVIAEKNLSYSIKCYDQIALNASSVSEADVLH